MIFEYFHGKYRILQSKVLRTVNHSSLRLSFDLAFSKLVVLIQFPLLNISDLSRDVLYNIIIFINRSP